MLHKYTHLVTYPAEMEGHGTTHRSTALLNNPAHRCAMLGERLQTSILENATNRTAQDKISRDGGCTQTELVLRTCFLGEPSEQKIESSNNIVSGFQETAALRDATEEMCFYISEPNSLPEKLEHTKNTGQKNKSGGRLTQRIRSTAFC